MSIFISAAEEEEENLFRQTNNITRDNNVQWQATRGGISPSSWPPIVIINKKKHKKEH